MNEVTKELQDWVLSEEKEGRNVDNDRLSQYAALLMRRHNNTPREEFNGLSPEELHHTLNNPFSDRSMVTLNKLNNDQYEKVPLVRQTLFLLQ